MTLESPDFFFIYYYLLNYSSRPGACESVDVMNKDHFL